MVTPKEVKQDRSRRYDGSRRAGASSKGHSVESGPSTLCFPVIARESLRRSLAVNFEIGPTDLRLRVGRRGKSVDVPVNPDGSHQAASGIGAEQAAKRDKTQKTLGPGHVPDLNHAHRKPYFVSVKYAGNTMREGGKRTEVEVMATFTPSLASRWHSLFTVKPFDYGSWDHTQIIALEHAVGSVALGSNYHFVQIDRLLFSLRRFNYYRARIEPPLRWLSLHFLLSPAKTPFGARGGFEVNMLTHSLSLPL
ncbi:hypothetical protein CYLTODRAFT_465339 [Cylindrobasidium torrendii FP15055 ss-10]|uniref:Uncharacterized protein n=1 Tax=Cylindrobasidium torrendii FP15055 ss-10 TaxID=1314674 RepID=A0A0D7B5U9_9AGAR|nr:hypothetical protein CYLTODRAFT_465339 [Cylindrobasidium torrendii FP15055 ss-10]